MRLVIAGVPRSGKTTHANRFALAGPIKHTDDLIEKFAWSELSAEVARWFDEFGPWCVEGVATARALRKWLAAHPEGKPCDRVEWFGIPRELLSKGQTTMAKGCETVWREIRPLLVARGVEIDER